jgi:single-stranded-DNA-specific exonuclease
MKSQTPMPADLSPALPRLVRRPVDNVVYRKAVAAGVPAVAARVLAGRGLDRGIDIRRFLDAPLSALDPPDSLADIDRAAGRVANAILSGETVAILSDYDVDGIEGNVTLRTALVDLFGHPAEKLRSFVGHRLTEGYGLAAPVADRILADRPRATLLITTDNGSSDEKQIARLKAAGIATIVVDHHELPIEGPPASAFAVINPQRTDCEYPDDSIAGGMVTWLLMCAVRQRLVEAGHLRNSANPLVELLQHTAASTIADCVSLASLNNRAVVRAGLQLINKRPVACWVGVAPMLKEPVITAETIAFLFAPMINARTRLADGMMALEFLLTTDVERATALARELAAHNEERKAIERKMLEVALVKAEACVAAGRAGIALLLEDGHQGVVGLCSSRIVERFGRPTFVFAPNVREPELITGSGRSIDGVHLRDALQHIADRHPGCQQKYGGHRAACGSRVKRGDFETFAAAFDQAVRAQVGDRDLGPVRYSDGELAPQEISMATLQSLEILEPTGRGFERASFDGKFAVEDVRPVGDGTHLRLRLQYGGRYLSGIWFKARPNAAAPLPLERGASAHLVYGLRANEFRGEARLDLVIEAAVCADGSDQDR